MKIVIGCPVKNRAWILPRWFDAVFSQQYLGDLDVEVVCVYTDSEDDTEKILKDEGVVILYDFNVGRSTLDIDRHYWGVLKTYQYMADMRNRLVDYCLDAGADYFFSLDSDILLPSYTFERLLPILQKHPGVVAPAVSMATGMDSNQRPVTAWNTMSWVARAVAERTYTPANGDFVDVVMAAMLMDRTGMNVRWLAHPQGEDAGFSYDAVTKGVTLWWEPSITCRHIMQRDN